MHLHFELVNIFLTLKGFQGKVILQFCMNPLTLVGQEACIVLAREIMGRFFANLAFLI